MSKVGTREYIDTYNGNKIFWSKSAKMYLIDTGKIIYFRPTLSEIKYVIDNLKGYQV